MSPVSETLNPSLAYAARTLGEIDAESIQFVEASESPSGKAVIIYSGAWSGTASVWEFTCEPKEDGGEDKPAESRAATLPSISSLSLAVVLALMAFAV